MNLNMQATFLLLVLILLSYPVFAQGTVLDEVPEAIKMESRSTKCRVNVCFAIDGSGNIQPWQFRIQRDFVYGVVRQISTDNRVNVAAVQYGLTNRVISPLTDNIPEFLKLLRQTEFIDSSISFTGAGVVYCQRQLEDSTDNRAKIVLLGTGQFDIGGDPAVRADLFRKDGGEVFAVGVGDVDTPALNEIAGGSDNVFRLRRRNQINELVESFVKTLC